MVGIAKDPGGGVTKLSEDTGYFNQVDPIVVRQDVKDYTQCYCIDMLDAMQQSITYTGSNMDIIVTGARLVDEMIQN